IEEAGDAQSLPDAAERQRTNRRAKLECLLIVRFSAAVAFTVVEAAVNVAVVVRENPVTGETGVGRRQVSDALAEYGALETISVDAFRGVDARALLQPETNPRAARRPVVEIELRIGVLQAECLAARQRRAGAGLARNVGSDAIRNHVIQIAGDVDVG